MIAAGNPTTDALLAALRHHADQPAHGVDQTTGTTQPADSGPRCTSSSSPGADARARRSSRRPDHARPRDRRLRDHRPAPPHRRGFPVPAIRCADGPSREINRAWSVMDFATGQPLLAGLSADREQASSNPAAPTTRTSSPTPPPRSTAVRLDGLDSDLGDHGSPSRHPRLHRAHPRT